MLKDRILFLDGEAIVLDKPAGLAVDPPRDGSLSLANHLESLKLGFHRPPVAVHRLDRDTSGCLLLARNPGALKRFGKAFEEGQVTKRYLAVVEGDPAGDAGTIDLPLLKDTSRREGWRMIADARGKSARTEWRVLARRSGRALVEFLPATGRTHQIRVHAATGLGTPIAGDPVYGRGGAAMLLHALSIEVPRAGKPPVAAEAPVPDSFAAAGFGPDHG